jgi:hypothetical protein
MVKTLISVVLLSTPVWTVGSLISDVGLRCFGFANNLDEDTCGAGCVPTGSICPERRLAAQVCARAVRSTTCGEGCEPAGLLEDWITDQSGSRSTAESDPEVVLLQALRYACAADGTSKVDAGCSRYSRALVAGVCGDGVLDTAMPTREPCPEVSCPEPEVAAGVTFKLQGIRNDIRLPKGQQVVCLTPNQKLFARMSACEDDNPAQEFTVERIGTSIRSRITNMGTGECLLHTGKFGPCGTADQFVLQPHIRFGGYRLKIPTEKMGAAAEIAGKCIMAKYPNKKQIKLNNILTPKPCPKPTAGLLFAKKFVFNLNPIL